MGIHYDYKSTRGDKAMKKEAKRKARIEERRAKRSTNDIKDSKEIDKVMSNGNCDIVSFLSKFPNTNVHRTRVAAVIKFVKLIRI